MVDRPADVDAEGVGAEEEARLSAARAQIRAERDPAALHAMLAGRSDAEITAFVMGLGPETVLEPCFAAMAERFLPDKASDRRASMQFDIVTPEGTNTWHVFIADGTAKTGPGAALEPTVTVIMKLAPFLRLVSGMLEGFDAFMTGAAKIKGDLMLAQTMLDWFDVPKAP